MSKVAHALTHGRSKPPETATEFRRRCAGGTFYPVAVHMALPVAK